MAAATCSSVLRSPERRGEGEMLRRRGDGGRGGDGSVMKQLRAREFLATTSRFPQLPATSMWEGVRTRALRYEDETAGYSEEKGCFCVGFDLTGNMLVGCMEDSTIRLLDPRQGGGGGGGGGGDGGGGARCRVVSILHGHSGPVNNFKFMDGYTLLTASDDKTVQQWDMRRLESSGCGRSGEGGGGEGERGGRRSSALVQKFVGHGGWVKNIEPLSRSEFLSSGLDGTVRIWDINEDGSSKVATGWRNNVILKHKKLCRMALSRDVNGERLIVSFCDEG
ncbi:hypothetical protein GUITHDRAFT_146331 [Guillardia theta CCMP2712]|uniref:Uncharacterized protein n=2 Tax=Guillardia theta TaxID=55529 RepID=L1IID8_GUITC|nr:hypothetical protein GUITHDRAFT_146331 [Guillardia theta CCMP2712]EKX35699.1 hypothetical protein GUITHDRAFT_146331 [Guillardia theta CCMP2712]|eukprot:XP_005822679.1 hypothetical protein GUITHDRAFT_146331 [Guillardia theta CCMP2712]